MPDLDGTLASLADPTRRRLVECLREAPRRPSDLADELGLTRPVVSRHLRVLRRDGLVEGRVLDDDARAREYRLRRAPFEQLRGWVESVEAFWENQLASFKAQAERGGPS